MEIIQFYYGFLYLIAIMFALGVLIYCTIVVVHQLLRFMVKFLKDTIDIFKDDEE